MRTVRLNANLHTCFKFLHGLCYFFCFFNSSTISSAFISVSDYMFVFDSRYLPFRSILLQINRMQKKKAEKKNVNGYTQEIRYLPSVLPIA